MLEWGFSFSSWKTCFCALLFNINSEDSIRMKMLGSEVTLIPGVTLLVHFAVLSQ